jgi:RHS repeat-associated protein
LTCDKLGKEIRLTGDLPRFGYTGEVYDPGTAHHYLGRRQPDPAMGRFLNLDTAREGSNPGNSTFNNPLRTRDPTRMWE